MARILFTDKEDRRTQPYPAINIVTAANMNEIKASVNAIYDILDTLKIPVSFAIVPGDFAGSTYQDARLVGLTPVTDFNVWSNEGSGVLLKYTDGYTFVSGTGTITMEPGDYRIEIYTNAV